MKEELTRQGLQKYKKIKKRIKVEEKLNKEELTRQGLQKYKKIKKRIKVEEKLNRQRYNKLQP